MEQTFGKFIKHRRLELEKGLRQFTEELNIPAHIYSKIERGLKTAPTGEALIPYLKVLEFNMDSEEHLLLEKLAKISNIELMGKIGTILTDKELIGKLPILISGKRFGKRKFLKLIELIRENNTPEI